MPFEYEALSWPALTAHDRATWRRLRTESLSLANPFYSLGWHDAVEAARGRVQVVRIARGGEVAGYFPFASDPFGMLRPVGAPMSDWHGFVGPSGLPLKSDEVLRAARGRAFRFSGAAANDPMLSPGAFGAGTSFVMDLSAGYEAYSAETKASHPRAAHNLRTALRKLGERHVEYRLNDRDPANLQTLLAMKRAQYRRTGQIDIFNFGWTRRLVEILLSEEETNAPDRARGLLSTMWIDGELAAAQFGLKSDGTLHYWFPVYEPRFAVYSPGIALIHEIARASASLGIRRIDLGDGDYRFKRELANQHLPIIKGTVRTGAGRRGAGPTGTPSGAAATHPTGASPASRPNGSDRNTIGRGGDAFHRGVARLSHGLHRRIDLLSSLQTWPPAMR